jgi:hypothetical protein
MRLWLLQAAVFFAGFLCFSAALLTSARLHRERIGALPSRRELLTSWIPGEFTPRGQQLRRRMGLLMLFGTILLAGGLVIAHSLEACRLTRACSCRAQSA